MTAAEREVLRACVEALRAYSPIRIVPAPNGSFELIAQHGETGREHSLAGCGNRMYAIALAAALNEARAEALLAGPDVVADLAREIHRRLKRGKRTEDHGTVGNLRCALDHLLPELPDFLAEPVASATEQMCRECGGMCDSGCVCRGTGVAAYLGVASATEPCGEYAGGVPRMGIALVCQRPRGHEGRHEAFASATEPAGEVGTVSRELLDIIDRKRAEACAERDAALARAESAERELVNSSAHWEVAEQRMLNMALERNGLAAEVKRWQEQVRVEHDAVDALTLEKRALAAEVERLRHEVTRLPVVEAREVARLAAELAEARAEGDAAARAKNDLHATFDLPHAGCNAGWGAIRREVARVVAERDAAQAALAQAQDLAESAWGIIANASGGDWSLQREDWVQAAARWRDRYDAMLNARGPQPAERGED